MFSESIPNGQVDVLDMVAGRPGKQHFWGSMCWTSWKALNEAGKQNRTPKKWTRAWEFEAKRDGNRPSSIRDVESRNTPGASRA